ncbi:hypothetical protein EDB89DRAFT_1927157 [Lactarius sanguifluus]|nr:hypothetical protein EDB89DRAFT_1927157 [Lactarius sanguifluus]
MFRRPHLAIRSGNVAEESSAGPGGHDYPQSAQNQTSQEDSNFADGSDHLFTMYNEMSAEEDGKTVERWKGDADGILVFTGLFSAAVATLVSVTIQDLRPNSQDTSPPPFTPLTYAVWVNSLWFLSLAISLTCAMLATLLQQWARRYLKITQPRYRPHKRAIIREFFVEGVEKLHLPWMVEALPTLLHISLFLFFAGLAIFLYNVHLAVFIAVLGWVALCVIAYGCITLMPIFWHNSPYCTPLSSFTWVLLHGIFFAILWCCSIFERFGLTTPHYMIYLGKISRQRFVKGMVESVEQTVSSLSFEIYARALMWAFDSLDEDHELERFFAGIPGLCGSEVVSDPFQVFIAPNERRLSEALIGLMQRTLTSPLVNEQIRRRRSLICIKAMRAASLPIKPYIFQDVFNGAWDGVSNFVDFGHFLWRGNYNDRHQAYYSTCMVAIVMVKVKERDDRWFQLAMNHLGISAPVLESYLSYGDSVLLANWIRVIRCIIPVPSEPSQDRNNFVGRKTLELVSKFDIKDTLPTLQHDFCELWNEIVGLARFTPDHRIRSLSIAILKDVRHAYIALHDGTDSAPTAFSATTIDDERILFSSSSYPLCNIPDHRPHHASHSQDAHTGMKDSAFPAISPHDASPPAAHHASTFPTRPHNFSTTRTAQGLGFFPAPQHVVSPIESSRCIPQIVQIRVDAHQPPAITTHTPDLASVSLSARTSVVLSTTCSVPQSTPVALTSAASLPTPTSSSSGINTFPYHATVHTVSHSVMPDTPLTLPILVLGNTAVVSVGLQSSTETPAPRSDRPPSVPEPF